MMTPPEDDAATEPNLSWLGEPGAPLRTLARIWATVELERALADLGADPTRAAAAVEDPLLGARVVLVAADTGGADVALAEPSTEGRLAAVLARHDEGPAGRYVLAPAGLEAVRDRAAAADVQLSQPAVGPFGWSVLVLGGSVAGGPVPGRSLILVDPAAVPSRP
jgi:hypothetical protein